jgi:3-isopropylmalate/(R)-2-methylmalate dehydratase small subunit
MVKSIHSGRIWILGDNIDTDLIVPSHVLTEQDQDKLLKATLEVLLPHFSQQVQPGDLLVAGTNFGCGSSREEAVFVLKRLGIHAILAVSYARIFYRNCINLGLPPITLIPPNPTIRFTSHDLGIEGDSIEIDYQSGKIRNLRTQYHVSFTPFPSFVNKYLKADGVLNYLSKKNLKL